MMIYHHRQAPSSLQVYNKASLSKLRQDIGEEESSAQPCFWNMLMSFQQGFHDSNTEQDPLLMSWGSVRYEQLR